MKFQNFFFAFFLIHSYNADIFGVDHTAYRADDTINSKFSIGETKFELWSGTETMHSFRKKMCENCARILSTAPKHVKIPKRNVMNEAK